MTTTAALGFGDLDVKLEPPLFGMLDPGQLWIAALAEGTDWGTPEATVTTVASMLMDGDKASITRFGNRIAVIPLQITGENLDVVADGEEIVMAEVNKGRNVFRWTPPGPAETSVFDVVYAKLDFKFDDLAENRVTRYFTLTLECLASSRRDELTRVVATPIPDTEPDWTTIDDCTALTGWSTHAPSTIEEFNGGIRASTPTAYGGHVWMTRSGLSVPVNPDDYLVVEFATYEAPTTPRFYLNISDEMTDYPVRVAAVEPIAFNRARYYLEVPDGMTTLTSLTVIAWAYAPAHGSWLIVADVSKVDQPPFDGSRRQRSFTAEIGGTARTSADLIIEAETALGSYVLVHTEPVGGFPPPLRKWLTDSSSVETDPDMVSGGWQTLSSPSVYEIPAAMLDGTYSIVALVERTTGSGDETIGWSASTASPLGTSATDDSGSVVATLTTTKRAVELGVVTLPTVAVDPASTAPVVLTITGNSAIRLDEVWLFRVTEDGTAELSWFTGLDAGTVDPTKVEARSASLDNPHPSWIAGLSGTDAANISVADRMLSPGKHQFRPGRIRIFVVTPGATAQTVTVEAFERFQHHVTKRTL